MDGPGFHVDIGVLETAAADIAGSVSDQREVKLEHADLAAGAYGHDRLQQAMADFGDRWSEGFDILLKDAQAIGDILGRAARAYRDADAGVGGRLTGDPAKRVVDD